MRLARTLVGGESNADRWIRPGISRPPARNDLAGGGAGFLLVEADNPQEVNDFLMPYMGLMVWGVRAVNALEYDQVIARFRQAAGR